MLRLYCAIILFGLVSPIIAASPSPAIVAARYVFTDEKAVITFTDAPATVPYSIKTIIPSGWGPEKEAIGTVMEGKLEIVPLTEGLHIVTLGLQPPVEIRFLAITPPPAVKLSAALPNLPFSARKLFNKQPYTILTMGDSVTYTGDYKSMLVMLLKRATGNPSITAVDRSYPGRSVDAAVRFFPDDALATKPDLGVLMYGLNDQAGGCPLSGYLEQYAWIAQHMASELHADTIFMTPTPDISLAPDTTEYGQYTFRTIGFAESLHPLANALHIPLVDNFHLLWGKGGPTLDASGRSLQPIYPTGAMDQLTSMIESNGKGDGIHANALAHLAMAHNLFNTIMGIKPSATPLAFIAESAWTANGMLSRVTVKNVSGTTRSGSLLIYPLPDDEVTSTCPSRYTLAAGKTISFTVSWPRLKTSTDLLKYPANLYNEIGAQRFVAIDYANGGSRIYSVAAPTTIDAAFLRERQVVTGNTVTVRLREGKKVSAVSVQIPDGAEMGRVPLVRNVTNGKNSGVATAELAYFRFGLAQSGEAMMDGNLDEWIGHRWIPIGEPVQARWVQGLIDGRATPRECYLHAAFKAGKQGIFVAVQATGAVTKDNLTLFFDTREPQLLGTAGRYYWASGSFKDNGLFAMNKGETSKVATSMTGVWKATDTGANIEIFIPYSLMELTSWPTSGDLGVSLWWSHQNVSGGHPTQIFWTEDAHPWNPRWYGVIRLDDGSGKPLPFLIRIK